MLGKAVIKALVGAGFASEELAEIPEDSAGLMLVLDPKVMKPEYRRKEMLVQRANSGFGCRRSSGGNAVFCTAADGEKARWEKYDFVAQYIGAPFGALAKGGK